MNARPAISPSLDLEVLLELWRTVATDWRLDPSEALSLLGWRDRGGALFDFRDIHQAASRLELIIEFAPIAADMLGSEHAVRSWLRHPNQHLSGRTPIEQMAIEPMWLRSLIDGLVTP